ncbi:MAG: tRNA uridine-5-carboxymethylaminomethyl(34) synthesis GTPase MnmE [candidate division WOR-3 bacterium]|nr:MAG: tRNA uridine-5-carboxymethylaminomethyl(34) synthesis GTPase MnmE [candidate division WOR-3 bacterium]
MNPNDTIVACTTPPGYSSVAVIRVSGEQAFSFFQRIFRPQKLTAAYEPQRAYYGTVIDASNGDAVDTALAVTFHKPHSYTGEDVVEISCHGNPLIADHIVRIFLSLGARVAGNGEFTKRALLNGKIDLVQAEAVLDTVNAPCDQARKIALLQYEGKLSDRIYDIRSKIVDVLFLVEAAIDFPDEEDVECHRESLISSITGIVSDIDCLLKGASTGMKIKNGFRVLITGRANVGKSTLFNRIVGHDRAIVHEEPGTTRDYLEEDVQIGGLFVLLYDTAGILSKATGPDEIAQQRTRNLIHSGDLILLLFDGSESMNEEDVYLYNLVKARPNLLLVNKIDLNVRLSNELILSDSIKISAKTGKNFNALEKRIRDSLLPGVTAKEDVLITRHRHVDALIRARQFLIEAKNAPTMETMAYELHSALDVVGELTGKILRKEILDRIFEEFCIGK